MDLTNKQRNEQNQPSWNFGWEYTVFLSLGDRWHFNLTCHSFLDQCISPAIQISFMSLNRVQFFSQRSWAFFPRLFLPLLWFVPGFLLHFLVGFCWHRGTQLLLVSWSCMEIAPIFLLVLTVCLLIVLAFPWKWSHHLQIIPSSHLSFQS